jgi:hypothetical protein
MIAAIFRNNDRLVLFTIPIGAILVWFFSFYILDNNYIAPEGGVLYPILFELIKPIWLFKLLNLLILLSSAYLVSYISIKQEVTDKQNHFSAYFLILLNTYLNLESPLHPLMVGNFFFLLSLNSYLSTYRSDHALGFVFDGAFFLSVASLFYFPMLFFIPVVFVALLIMRTFIVREWLLILIGLALPYFLCAIFFFLFDIPQSLFFARYAGSFSKFSFPQLSNGSFLIHFAFIVILGVTFLRLLSHGLGGKIKTQKSKTLILISLMISFAASFFLHEHPTFAPVLVLVPFSILAGDGIGCIKKTFWVNFLSILFLSLLIISNLQAVGKLQY